jgi:hypothetical protein
MYILYKHSVMVKELHSGYSEANKEALGSEPLDKFGRIFV